jgi:hypothetical protein
VRDQYVKNIFLRLIAISIGLLISLGLAELTLRFSGFEPWQYSPKDLGEPILHEFDPVLGWKNKPGHYSYPAYNRIGPNVEVTFLDDSSRVTSVNNTGGKSGKSVVLVGCSFTEGWAVSDNETYPWKLQERFPSARFYNYGTAGYGTYQSLLMLERVLPRVKSPAVVIYGFIMDQEHRNVAPAEWLRLMSAYSRRAHLYLPYVTVDSNGKLIRHAPEKYITFPFREQSALAAFAEERYTLFKTRGRLERSHEATEKLILEMQKLASGYGAKFIVVLLGDSIAQRYFYRTFFDMNGITSIDCNVPLTAEFTVPVEGHPNGHAHSQWSKCISTRLQNILP